MQFSSLEAICVFHSFARIACVVGMGGIIQQKGLLSTSEGVASGLGTTQVNGEAGMQVACRVVHL